MGLQLDPIAEFRGLVVVRPKSLLMLGLCDSKRQEEILIMYCTVQYLKKKRLPTIWLCLDRIL